MNKKLNLQKIIFLLLFILSSLYVFLYSKTLSFNGFTMNFIYCILSLLLIFLDEEHLMYAFFFFLPMRKNIYFGSLAFYNIVMVILILKMIIKRKLIPIKSLLIAMFLGAYDILISSITYFGYDISAYMIKWYFSFFVFLYLLENKIEKFDYKKSILALNMGLVIIGVLTISQYSGFSIITGSIRNDIAGAGGMLDQNTYSFFCLMGAVSGFTYFFNTKIDKKSNLMMTICIGLSSIFNMICGMYMVSKAFYVVLACICIFALLLLFKDFKKNYIYIILLFLVVIVACSTKQVQNLINSIIVRFSKASNVNELTTGRSDLYIYYINAISDSGLHNFFGAGLSCYRLFYNAHNNYITHNTILELWAAWGIFGMTCIISIIVYYVRKYIYTNTKKEIVSYIPLITILLFSQTLSMFWEDASLFFFVYSVYISESIVKNKNVMSTKNTNLKHGDLVCH